MNTYRLFAIALLVALHCAVCKTALAQNLTRMQFPDGSGTVGVAPGWHVTSAGNGAVALTGSRTSAVTLGIVVNVVSRGVERKFPDMPAAAVFPGAPRVDFHDPARAAVDIIRFTSQHSSVSTKNLKIKAIEQAAIPNGKAVFMRFASTVNGKDIETFGLYAIMPVDDATGVFYYSAVAADKASYPTLLPTMMKMWMSWSLSTATIRKRLQEATRTLGEIDVQGITDSVLAERRRVAEKAARDFQEYIRQ